jgi:hypothetical protein
MMIQLVEAGKLTREDVRALEKIIDRVERARPTERRQK